MYGLYLAYANFWQKKKSCLKYEWCQENCDMYLSADNEKPVFGVSNQVWQKMGCTATEDG